MRVARQVYLYAVSYISLLMVLAGASNLLQLLLRTALGIPVDRYGLGGDNARQQFSLWAAMLVVGGVVWAIHWWLAQRGVASANPDAAAERRSVLRKLFLYGVMATALWQVAFALADLIRTTLQPDGSDFGATPAEIRIAGGAQLLVYGLAWLYHWRVRGQDDRVVPETGPAATVRRWYFYLAGYVLLSALLIQAATLLGFVWKMLTGGDLPWAAGTTGVPVPLASSIAWLITAGGLWAWHWWQVQRRVARDPDEQRSVLRKVYLYSVTLQTVAVTLANLAFFLNSLFRLVWGSDPRGGSGEPILAAAGGPILTALVYGVFWAYHWQILKQDARLPVAGPAVTAALRRLYYYLIALLGLSMLAVGVADTLRLLVDGLLGGSATTNLSQREWGDQVALVATLVVVGGVAWVLSWWPMQREALAPDGETARQTLPRRLYLLVVLFATVVSLLSSAAWLLYQLLRNFGEPAVTWVSDMSWALAATLTAVVLLAYHVTVLRADLRVRGPAPAQAPAATAAPAAPGPAAILLLQGADGPDLESAVAAMQRDLPAGTRLDVMSAPGVTAPEIAAWLQARAPVPAPPAPPLTPQPA